MRKNLCIGAAALLGLVLGAQPLQAQDNVVDEVIWVVGEEPILKSDVEQSRLEMLAEMQSSGQRFDGDPYCVIPENLAIQKLFLHQASIDSIEVSDSEVQQSVEQRVNFFVERIGSTEKVEEYFGKSMTQIREKLFESTKNEMLISQVRSNLTKDTKVTPAQVRKYFDNMPEDSLPFIPTKMEVQILVRKPIISQEEIDRVKDELRSYTDRVNKGETQFSTLALLYSEDKASAQKGGELGFLSRHQLVPEFSAVAFNLTDPKVVSKIVETEYGFHIIQLIEKRGDRMNVRHILKRPRVSDESLTACIAQVDSIVDGVRKGDYTFEEAAAQTSEDVETRANNGLMTYTPSAYMKTSKFELQNLPSEVAKQVANMAVGDISKPFVMVNDKGREVVAVVRLKNKINGHRATMKSDYQDLQAVVEDKINQEKVDKWVREMQKKTYIRINENWRNCEFKYPGWIHE